MKVIKVRCSFEVMIELPDDANEVFAIEENSCPATGEVGATLQKLMDEHEEAGTCWACAANGKNKILSVEVL